MATKNKYSKIDLSKYDKGYQTSGDVQVAQKLKEQAEGAVRKYGDFKYSKQGAYDKAMEDILSRKAFSYDMNADAFYQQYKDMYTSQGKLAMMDTMGQAAALTGGYGNSYAASVGNQAYQGYLQQLNAVAPELYSLALSAYNAEGERLNNNFGILSADRGTQYGEWMDKYNILLNDRGYYSDNYNNAYTQDYNRWNDDRAYDTNQYWNEYNAGYQAERDAVTDSQWQKSFDEGVRQFNEQMAFNRSKSSGSGGGYGGSPYTGKVESSFKQTTGENRFDNVGTLFTKTEYEGFIKTVSMHRGNEGRAQIIEDAVLEGKITEKQADELLEKYGISEEDFKRYRGIE